MAVSSSDNNSEKTSNVTIQQPVSSNVDSTNQNPKQTPIVILQEPLILRETPVQVVCPGILKVFIFDLDY